jgi:multiple sugar transport system ATP-binding protein
VASQKTAAKKDILEVFILYMSRIQLENITKTFDDKTAAVSDFSLEIPEGCFMVIVGPSGCGKTTTLRLIAGLEKVDSGNIYIGETLVNNVSAKERDIAMVFQNYILYPHMTAFQNMAFALKMRKVPRKQIKEHVEETAKMLEIEDLLHRKPHALSGGQRQRVALGKAIVRKPCAFLFDEPLSNLDAKMRLTMRAELKTLHQKLKTTTIYVTHDQAEAMTLGENICVMNNGKIQQVGRPMEIYEKPANKFVAGFFGTPSMNFFNGSIVVENGKTCFRMSDCVFELPQKLRMNLKASPEKEVILGIRPENISLKSLKHEENTLSAKVEIIEPLGNRTDVYLRNQNGERFILSASHDTDLKVNQTITVQFDTSRIHLFETSQSGKNIVFP